MNPLIKGLLGSAILWLLKIFQGVIVNSLRIEAVKAYVKTVEAAREFGLFTIRIACILLLLATGFAMIHAGIFLFLFLTGFKWAAVFLVLILGIIYMGTAVYFLRQMCSEKTWLEASKASEWIREVSKIKGTSKNF